MQNLNLYNEHAFLFPPFVFPKEPLGYSEGVRFGRRALRPAALWLASGHLQVDFPRTMRGLNSRDEFNGQSMRR